MGEAAEWELYRRFGIDTSDNGWVEQAHRRIYRYRHHRRATTDELLNIALTPIHVNCRSYMNTAGEPEVREKPRSKHMNTKELVRLMQLKNGASIFSAVYVDGSTGKQYHFVDTLGLQLEEGDIVVVETRDTFSLVRVMATNLPLHSSTCGIENMKRAVDKVDFAGYDDAKKREGEAEEKLAMAEVYERLEKYGKQMGPGFQQAQALLGTGTRSVAPAGFESTNETEVVDPNPFGDRYQFRENTPMGTGILWLEGKPHYYVNGKAVGKVEYTAAAQTPPVPGADESEGYP